MEKVRGLAGIVASAMLAGAAAFGSLSAAGCGNQEIRANYIDSEKAVFNLVNSVISNRPEVSRKSGNQIFYHDKSLKFSEDRIDPVAGRGRYALLNEKDVSIGYCDADIKTNEPIEKFKTAFVYAELNGKKTIFLLQGSDFISFSETQDGWEKLVYNKAQFKEGADVPNLPATIRVTADIKEVEMWVEMGKKLRNSLAR